VGSFGERLRREREMRGITLDEIAAATKIGTRSLKALEDEDFKKLPGGIFNKGFVRAYAKFLGISEEQAVADYLTACGEPEEVTEIDPAQLLAQREESEAKSKAASRRARDLQSVQTDSSSGFPWMALLGLAIILALAWGGRAGYYKYRAHREAQAQAQREAEAKAQADAAAAQVTAAQQVAAQDQSPAAQPLPDGPADNISSPTPASATPATSAPKPESKQQPKPAITENSQQFSAAPKAVAADADLAKAGNFVVSIRARQRTWVSVMADGKRVISGELAASSEKTVQARNQITLKTGNAGGTDLAFNGKALPSLGADNQVRTVTINADGSVQ
jgi:cytoskeleton protein RodZ